MAFARVGTAVNIANTGASGTTSITVPTGATHCLVVGSGWNDSSLNLTQYRYNSTSGGTGTAFSISLNLTSTGTLQCVFAGLVATGGVDGTVNVYWEFSSAPAEGFTVGFIFFTDASSINDADATRWAGVSTNETVTIDSNSTDIVIGFVESFEDETPVLDTAATILWTETNHNSDWSTAGDITTVGDPTTTVQGDGDYGNVCAVSIIGVAVPSYTQLSFRGREDDGVLTEPV